jgi:hypothetical protein
MPIGGVMNSIRVAVWSYEFERLAHVEITDPDTRQDPAVVRHYSADVRCEEVGR